MYDGDEIGHFSHERNKKQGNVISYTKIVIKQYFLLKGTKVSEELARKIF